VACFNIAIISAQEEMEGLTGLSYYRNILRNVILVNSTIQYYYV